MMRMIFCGLIFIHAAIHLLGFVKAFNPAKISALTMTISKSMGIVWLLACLAFILSAILFLSRNPYWWIVLSGAIVCSQVLVILYWQDAKFGTLANILLFTGIIIGYAQSAYVQTFQKDKKACIAQYAFFSLPELSEKDIAHVPEPVKKYIRYAGCIGKPKVHNFKVDFEGRLRSNEKSDWMRFMSTQYNFIETPVRLFFMKAVMKQLPVAGYHRYINGKAMMDIRLLSLIKVQYMDGPDMDTAETVTVFNDMCCQAPATLIDSRIRWLEVKGNEVLASFTNQAITIHARLFFNEEGQLINFVSNDRFSADAGCKLPWSTPLKNYQLINGHRLATAADAAYEYPSGWVTYGTFVTKSILYNVSE